MQDIERGNVSPRFKNGDVLSQNGLNDRLVVIVRDPVWDMHSGDFKYFYMYDEREYMYNIHERDMESWKKVAERSDVMEALTNTLGAYDINENYVCFESMRRSNGKITATATVVGIEMEEKAK